GWLIHETSFKPWPACRHTHAAIDCMLALRAQLGAALADFSSCTVETFGDAVAICNDPAPVTRTQAKLALYVAPPDELAKMFSPANVNSVYENWYSLNEKAGTDGRALVKKINELKAKM
ncbi:MAG TPA: hypothetical protein VGH48_15575, partial [Caldimonas sp.]